MKKNNFIFKILFCVLYSLISFAYAGGEDDHDHDHDDVSTKNNLNSNKIELAPKVKSSDIINNITTESFIKLNAKVVTNANSISYLFSPFDGLLKLNKPIVLGQTVKKGQILGTIQTVLTPLEKINQNNQYVTLLGDIQQQKNKLKRYQLIPELVAKKDIDETIITIDTLQKQINLLQNNIKKETVLVAPITGIVTRSILNANKIINTQSELLQITPFNYNNIEIQAEYYLTGIDTGIDFNLKKDTKDFKAFLLKGSQKIPLLYLGHIPFISELSNKNSITLRFKLLDKNIINDINFILGQSLTIHLYTNSMGVNHVK
jgi:hypothetical protein